MVKESEVWLVDQLPRGSSAPTAPFLAKPPPTAAPCETVVGSSSRIKGQLFFSESARLEGDIEGDIESQTDLVIGENGSLAGNIIGKRVQVFGRVSGDIRCDERLEIFSGARVEGNIFSPRVVMHDGVVFDGCCRMEQAKKRDNSSRVELSDDDAGLEQD